MKSLIIYLVILISLAGCAGTPAVGGVATPRPPAPPAPPPPIVTPAIPSLPAEVLAMFEESLMARAGTPAAQDLISSIKSSLTGSSLGKGTWEVAGKGRWLIKEAGPSVQPLDSEARQLLEELQAMGPTPTPRPVSTPRTTPVRPTPTPVGTPTPTPTPVASPTTGAPITPVLPGATPALVVPSPTPFVPPAGWTLYQHQIWRYAFVYPPGWSIDEFGNKLYLQSAEKDAKIVVTAGRMGKSLDEWTEETVEETGRRLWNYKLLSKERFTRGALEGWTIAYSGRIPYDLAKSGFRDIMISDGEVGVWVSAYSQSEFPEYMAALEQITKSVDFVPRAPTPVPWWYLGK